MLNTTCVPACWPFFSLQVSFPSRAPSQHLPGLATHHTHGLSFKASKCIVSPCTFFNPSGRFPLSSHPGSLLSSDLILNIVFIQVLPHLLPNITFNSSAWLVNLRWIELTLTSKRRGGEEVSLPFTLSLEGPGTIFQYGRRDTARAPRLSLSCRTLLFPSFGISTRKR